jgi:hypothetical protein
MENAMNLIDTYISEVGRQLPGKTRADIETELRSILQDMLEERAKNTGKPVDDELTLQILQEYGSPEHVAASYRGERYLVGPKLYPSYIKVLQIVLPIVGVLSLVGLGLSLIPMDAIIGPGVDATIKAGITDFLEVIGEAISGFFGSMISALGVITLIFALLERFATDLKTDAEKWEAKSLLKISPPDKIKPVEMIVEIFFCGLGILVFNFFPEVLGYTPSLNNLSEAGYEVIFIPLFSEAFFRYVPYLTVIWVLTILLNCVLFSRGRWETWSRWLFLAINAASIGITLTMLLGPSLGTLQTFVPEIFFADPNIFKSSLNLSIRLALVVSIVVESVEFIQTLVTLLKRRPTFNPGVQ